MEILQKTVDLLSKVPAWTFLYVVPALIAAAAVGFVFAPKRRWFYPVAAIIGMAGFLFAFANDKTLAVFYLGFIALFCALLSLLFLIPCPKKQAERVKKSREEAIYEKFHEPLSEQPYKPRSAMPPKVCCFEAGEEDGATAEEYGMRLSYADTLLEKLRAKKLNAGDRLETEELLRRLDCYRNKPLTGDERNTLNDCLASILKLTAKYQL